MERALSQGAGQLPLDPWGQRLCLSCAPARRAGPTICFPTARDGTEGGTGAAQEHHQLAALTGTGATDGLQHSSKWSRVVAIVAIPWRRFVVPGAAAARHIARAALESYAIEAAAFAQVRSQRRESANRRGRVRDRNRRAAGAPRDALGERPAETVRVPDDVRFDAPAGGALQSEGGRGRRSVFFASGMFVRAGRSRLTRLGVGYQVRVNWLTGGVEGCFDRSTLGAFFRAKVGAAVFAAENATNAKEIWRQ